MNATRKRAVRPIQTWIAMLAILAGLTGLAGSGSRAWAQAAPGETPVHQIAAVTRPDPAHLRLTLSGDLPTDYGAYFDIFPVETSTNLTRWSVVGAVVRTNTLPGPVYSVVNLDGPARFYRTPPGGSPTAFPPPTGPYPVGAVSRLLSSPTRTTTQPGPNREFMVSLFYPAAPGPWNPREHIVAADYGDDMFLFSVLRNPRPVQVVTSLVSHASTGLALRESTQPYPVVIYCHGGTYFRRDNVHKLCELASHGYVVVAADYYHAWYSYLPDGTLVPGPGSFLSEGEEYCVNDTRFLVDQLEVMNASDSMFRDRLDLGRIGILGWSVGGAEAGDVCRVDPRVQAAVMYDGAFWIAPGLTQGGLDKPFLCINATVLLEPGWAEPALDLFRAATQNAIFFQMTGAEHTDFSDLVLVDEPGATQLKRTGVVMDYTRAFFNRHLLGTTEPLLDGPKSGAGITNWKKK